MSIRLDVLTAEVARHPYPLLFATVSGAHLYGFPSADSDYDLRGVHVLPVEEMVGLVRGLETVQTQSNRSSAQVDLVTHDAAKFARMLLKPNGYVLEQLYSPLVVHDSPAFDELRALGRGCITRRHVRHYVGFAMNQWSLFANESPPRVKPLLYVYRVLLTGIHLLRTGEVNANLVRLNETFKLAYLPELIERKRAGLEQSVLGDADRAFHAAEFARLMGELEEAGQRSSLPGEATSAEGLNSLVVRARLQPAG